MWVTLLCLPYTSEGCAVRRHDSPTPLLPQPTAAGHLDLSKRRAGVRGGSDLSGNSVEVYPEALEVFGVSCPHIWVTRFQVLSEGILAIELGERRPSLWQSEGNAVLRR